MEKYTQEEIQELIIHSAKEANILPIISRCNSKCIFCSHHNNPKDVRVVSIGTRSIEEIKETLPYLNGENEITIGESASNIIEGEPTLHPDFAEIMKLIRSTYPDAPISVTTNGRYLTDELINLLSDLGNIRINLSLNSATVEGRKKLMDDTEQMALTAIASVKKMNEHGMRFSASMVGMPNVTGYDDIEYTVRYLSENGATSVQIFMPGFSSFVKEDIFPEPDTIHAQLKEFIGHLSTEIPCPVMLEPSYVKDLSAELSGVLHDTPAWNAGLRRGDVILQINEIKPRTRVEAWNIINMEGKKAIKYRRGESEHTTTFDVDKAGFSGISVEYDYNIRNAEYLIHMITTAPGKVLALTSEFAYPVISEVYKLLRIPQERSEVYMVKNHTFGGTIRAAGLLTNDDYFKAYEEYVKDHEEPEAILIPQISYNYLGKDLCGRSFTELQEKTGKAIAFIA